MQIIVFPFAGGSRFSFQKFSVEIENMTVMDYPGRSSRINESLIIDIHLLVDDMAQKLSNQIASMEDEYIVYGHSMGAAIAHLICQKIEKLGLKKPSKLVISGKKTPSIGRELKIAHLENNEFWEELVKLGGIPNELTKHTELIEFYTPILKADFTAVENYQYVKKEKLTIPIDVFYGSEEATEEEMLGWKEETTEKVTITQLEGNHFFIFNHIDYFNNYFKNLTKTIKHSHV